MIDKSVDIVYYNDNSNDYCYLRIKRNTNIKSYREKEIIIMKKWVCTVCGYVYEGENAPEFCPVCKAPASKFKEQSGERHGLQSML